MPNHLDADSARELVEEITHMIDLAEALLYVLERLDGPKPDHASKNCWVAGNDGHLQCTPPEGI